MRAFDGETPISEWSSALSFEVRPADELRVTSTESTTNDPVPTISWTIISGAVTYDIEIDDVTNGTTAFVSANTIPDTVFRPESPLDPGRYQVRVRYVDVNGTRSDWSTPFDLTIETTAEISLVRPTAGSATPSENAQFVWTPVTNVARYELLVNNLTTGTNRVIDETNLLTNEFIPTTELPAGDYRAWVRAILTDGTVGLFSVGVDFTLT